MVRHAREEPVENDQWRYRVQKNMERLATMSEERVDHWYKRVEALLLELQQEHHGYDFLEPHGNVSLAEARALARRRIRELVYKISYEMSGGRAAPGWFTRELLLETVKEQLLRLRALRSHPR